MVTRFSKLAPSPEKSFFSLQKKDEHNPLVEAAENAHLLTKELRAHGFDAYEFHDRTESIVTIGSFDQTAQRLPDGRVVVIPEVQKIVQMFDASYDTPADPLTGIGNDARTQRLVEEEEQDQAKTQRPAGSSCPGDEPQARENPQRARQKRDG